MKSSPDIPRLSSSSSMLTVAVPNFPTTTPAAELAIIAASCQEAEEALLRVKLAMTVSPAPVTSYTSRASAGI